MPVGIGEDGKVWVLAPTGDWKEAPVTKGPDGQAIYHDGKDWQSLATLRGEVANKDAGLIDNVIRSVARGATFGFADEIAAAGNATFGGGDGTWGERYDRALETERGRDKAFDKTNPVISTAGQMGGGLMGAFATPLLTPFRGASAGAAVGNAAVNAGVGGTVAGFGEGEGGLGNRIESAAKGGAIGTGVGTGLTVAGRLASGVGQRLANATGFSDPEPMADRLLLKALTRDKVSLDDVAARAGGVGPEAILPDVAGRNTVSLGAVASRVPGEAADAAERVVAARRDAAPDRIAQYAQRAFGGGAGGDVADATETLMRGRSAKAAPLYEKAMAVTPEITPELADILKDPRVQKAIQSERGLQEMENRGSGVPFSFNPMQGLDAAKKGLDTQIEALLDPVTRRPAPGNGREYNALSTIRDRLVGELDKVNPDYAAARQAWAGPSQALDAIVEGRKFVTADRDAYAKAAARVPEAYREFFQLGAGRAVTDLAADPARAATAARRLVEDRRMADKLATALPDDASRAELIRQLSGEVRMSKVNQAINPSAGSQTAPLIAGMDEMNGNGLGGMVGRLLESGTHGGIGGMTSRAVLDLMRRSQGLTPSVADALAPKLYGQSPEAIQETVKALRQRAIADALANERATAAAQHRSLGLATAAVLSPLTGN